MFARKAVTFILIFSVVSGTLYLPVFAPRSEAFLGFGDIVIDIKALVDRGLDAVAMGIAQRMVDEIVRSTVNWAQTGFEGNPAYVTDPSQYFTGIADGVAGDFISASTSPIAFLCSPFQTQIRLALLKQYIRAPIYQCTFTRAIGNLEAFYGDFSQGGWDGWFVMTQNNANNPYGAFLQARTDLDSRIARAVNIEREQLRWNQGFLSWGPCAETDPNTGECKPGSRGVETPGSVIKSQLDEILPSGLNQLITTNHWDQLITAFASGLLQRYVFNSNRGLFTSNASASNSARETIDLDGDGIDDGWDTNDDGVLDICHHGRRNNSVPPSNENCYIASEVNNSPYFASLCSNLDRAVKETGSLVEFVNTQTFGGKEDAVLWGNKLTYYAGALDSLVGTLLRLDISQFYDDLSAWSGHLKYANDHINELSKEQRLAYSPHDNSSADGFREYAPGLLAHLRAFRTQLGQCEAPNIDAAGNLSVPAIPQGGGSNVSESNGNGNGEVCATQEEIDQFLIDNPGDEGRLDTAFPCN